MRATFKNTEAFNQTLENWNIGSVTNMLDLLENANAYYFENFDNTLIAWAAAQNIPLNIDLGNITPEYCASNDAIAEFLLNRYFFTLLRLKD